MEGIKQLTCGHCGEVTYWPEENEAAMFVWAVAHAADSCPLIPVDLKAEAVATWESLRVEASS